MNNIRQFNILADARWTAYVAAHNPLTAIISGCKPPPFGSLPPIRSGNRLYLNSWYAALVVYPTQQKSRIERHGLSFVANMAIFDSGEAAKTRIE